MMGVSGRRVAHPLPRPFIVRPTPPATSYKVKSIEMNAKVVEDLAVTAADAKTALKVAKEAFAAAEKEWFKVGHWDYTTADGRQLTTVHSTVRSIDGEIVKASVGRGVWQRITVPTIDTKAFDVECDGGRIDNDEIAAAVTFKDRKPSVRVK